ncbi:auxin-responsive protein IAA26-like [Tripterygium wilfordii]|uniref:Auxin-responsive protein n=1 Tax=Tripterygium wilfordii TaxID=458696 RepID=A0A7J7BWC3_TRIWF|nr:auxin-responsive protein IAA2-like isoform X2 [Tripterygium wilfordii]KAF5726183.1 auxin-responsive protein IAA26-like [Tripterygium wilfordii]
MEKHPKLFYQLKSEDKKLELRLGPPGDHNTIKTTTNGAKAVVLGEKTERNSAAYIQYPLMTQMGSFIGLDSAKLCDSAVVELQCSDNKAVAVSATPTTASSLPANGETVASGSHKRTAAVPIVGWPPVRSFRKKLTDNYASKLESESPKKIAENINGKDGGTEKQHLFVKINMEGVPIGRKVDLKAYDSYEKLSVAIDKLFRGLLAAQGDLSAAGNEIDADESKGIAGSGSGRNGEYTLVYEDYEGDRILVGDVPWQMFVSTAKRLRVLKSSELSTLRNNKGEQEKTSL